MDLDANLQDLFNWVDNHNITRQKKNLHRDFSDAVPLAEILKSHFPRWVELHNYSSKNSVSQKCENWFTLNRKVLTKLDINLTQTEMLNIAKCTPGAIEKLLLKVKKKVDEYEKEEPNQNIEKSGDVVGDASYDKVKSKTVPIELYENLMREMESKNEEIEILNEKINHLQNMLTMKEDHIKDLEKKLDEYIAKDNNSLGFFNRFIK